MPLCTGGIRSISLSVAFSSWPREGILLCLR
jgi:hypothetical protein